MSAPDIIINGHFRTQQVTGVQQYTWEILSQFDQKNISYGWVEPPEKLKSDTLRQLWMQSVMPYKLPKETVLWSPTNIGPVWCENQVLTLHDIAGQLHPEWYDKKYVTWRQFVLPKLLRRVRKVLTVSEYSRETIAAYYPRAADKISVIYPGIRTDFFYPREQEEIDQMREALSLKKPFVLIVSSIAARKNISGLLKAWNRMPKRIHQEMELVVTGGSAAKFAFNQQEEYHKSVRFTGYVDKKQLPRLYSAAELFVYPSFFEGFGSPVVEALACGTAVVTSNVTAMQETAGPALTVNPHSSDEICSAMLALLESETKRSEIAAQGPQWAQKFSWEQTADNVYKQLRAAL